MSAAATAASARSSSAAAPGEQTLEQIRMRFALAVVRQILPEQQVQPVHANTLKECKEYVARCKNLPAQVLQNGLNQALAFCASKEKEKSYAAVLQQLDDWLTGRGAHYAALGLPHSLAIFSDAQPDEKVLDVMQRHSMDDYILATSEALHLLHHIKRFASAFALEEGKPGDSAASADYADSADSAEAQQASE